MSIEENLAKSIREGSLSRVEKAYIASMPARDELQASIMIGLIKRLYGLDVVHRASHLSGYDCYTYVSVTDEEEKSLLFRKNALDGVVLLEMQDYQGEWHVLFEAGWPWPEFVSKKEMLEILRGGMPNAEE